MKKIKKVSKLEELEGLGSVSLERLYLQKITKISQVASMDPAILKEITGLSDSSCLKVLSHAKSSFIFDVKSGKDLLMERKQLTYCKTGSQNLDSLLAGGLEEGSIIEFYGAFGSGKSQIIFSTISRFLCQEQYKNKKLLVVDTEDTYRPERISQILNHKQIPLQEIEVMLQRILVYKPNNVEQQMLIISNLSEQEYLATPQGNIQLSEIKYLAVDSLVALFRSSFLGRGNLQERQQKLNHHISEISDIVKKNKMFSIVTNQVTSSPDLYSPEIIPVGGNIVGHSTTYRIRLKRYAGGIRSARMMDSPSHPEEEVKFKVDESGIHD